MSTMTKPTRANSSSAASAAPAVKKNKQPVAKKAASGTATPLKTPRPSAALTPKSKPGEAAAAPKNSPEAPAKAKAQAPEPQSVDPKKSVAPSKAAKEKKVKVVRDSFTLPKTELLQITAMKKRAISLGVEVKKSELIRAGLRALAGMADNAFKKAMADVPTIKTGRPAKH
jgi:hypothetical protein